MTRGYRNIRIDGRSIVEVHPENADKIRRIFELYAYHSHTLDTLGNALIEAGIALCIEIAAPGDAA